MTDMTHGSEYLWTDTDTDWCKVAENRQVVIDRQNVELIDMRSELATVERARDRWFMTALIIMVSQIVSTVAMVLL